MHGSGLAGGFFVLWFLLMVGMVVGWVVFLVAVWRGMKAHESIAQSVAMIAATTPGPERSSGA